MQRLIKKQSQATEGFNTIDLTVLVRIKSDRDVHREAQERQMITSGTQCRKSEWEKGAEGWRFVKSTEHTREHNSHFWG